MFQSAVRRHPWVAVIAALALIAVVSVPVVAYVVVPQLVRSTLVESLPAPSATSVPVPGAGQTTPLPSTAAIETLLKGELVRINAADYGSGLVRVVRIDAGRFLSFEGVDIAGAPDMHVYLSDRSDGKPGTFVELGKLKATNGSFNYPIPPSVDLGAVHSMVVWCRQFAVTITYAELR